MKKNNSIQTAIDDSLRAVHFSEHDMRRVLRETRRADRKSISQRTEPRRKSPAPGYALAAAMLVLVIAPLSLLVLRMQSGLIPSIKDISAAPGETTAAPLDVVIPDGSAPVSVPTALPDDGVFDERDAIAAARACFEAQCDTEIFSFEEYTVSVTHTESEHSEKAPAFIVQMDSIYDNGCSFCVTVDAEDGEILAYSTPRLATVPMYLDTESAQVRSWYEQYGPHIFAWPLNAQAEFSRRYEGAALRMPRAGEADAQTVISLSLSFIQASELTDNPGEEQISCYVQLFSERASADGQARYLVYCFAGGEITHTLPSRYALITFRASDGAFESKQIFTTNGLSL